MERMSTLVTEDSEEVALQRERHSAAIGDGTPTSVIQDILSFAEDAQLPDFYIRNQAEEVWYEMLEKDGLETKIGKFADNWAENRDNIERAMKHVGRKTINEKPPDVKGFAFCRFKAAATTTSWYLLQQGPGVDKSEQTVVFIALEDLGPENGFPFPLSRGQYVCMDGNASIWTPPTGGGMAIFLSLSL